MLNELKHMDVTFVSVKKEKDLDMDIENIGNLVEEIMKESQGEPRTMCDLFNDLASSLYSICLVCSTTLMRYEIYVAYVAFMLHMLHICCTYVAYVALMLNLWFTTIFHL